MKYLKIFIAFFLIIFTNQDATTDSLNSLANSDFGKCMSASTSTCKSLSLSNKKLECCIINTHYYSYPYSNYDFDMCFAYTTTKITKSQIESMEQVYRESCGFILISMGYSYLDSYSEYMLSFRQTYDCKSQNFAIDYKIGSYTEEEKKYLMMKNTV